MYKKVSEKHGFSLPEVVIAMGLLVGSLFTIALFQGFQNQSKKELLHEVAKLELDKDIRVSLLRVNNCLCNFQGKFSFNAINAITSPSARKAMTIPIPNLNMDECLPSANKVAANSTYKSSGFGALLIEDQRLEGFDVVGDSTVIANYIVEAKRDARQDNADIMRIPMTFRFDDSDQLVSCSANAGGVRKMVVRTVSNAITNTTYHYYSDVVDPQKSCRLGGRPLASIRNQPSSIPAPPTNFTYTSGTMSGPTAEIYAPLANHLSELNNPPTKTCVVSGDIQTCRTESLYIGGLGGIDINSIPDITGFNAQIFKDVTETTRSLSTGAVSSRTFFASLSGNTEYPKQVGTNSMGQSVSLPDVSIQMSDYDPTNGVPDGTTVGDVKCVKGWWRQL